MLVELVLDFVELRQELNEKVWHDSAVIDAFPCGLGCLARSLEQLLQLGSG